MYDINIYYISIIYQNNVVFFLIKKMYSNQNGKLPHTICKELYLGNFNNSKIKTKQL